ncbi:MAG TPA: coproporphyrinogen dehydrogenase, partial [Rhodospirillales bacterium]|nr:coproporphyrinogen dehydrogenase [Rhodospirillales bacterium]
ASAGVNRASIGVQGFHPEVQKAINRIQPFQLTEQVVGWLRKHGVNDINMDLLYGLPHQTVERVRKQAEMAASLKPVRVALFGYAHVPWMKSNQKMIDEAALPGVTERWKQFVASSEALEKMGYLAIGLDHFALPADALAIAMREGRLHRNFQGYTTDEATVMLGFGASGIGLLPQGYAQNAAPLNAYAEAVKAGRLPISRGLALTAEDKLRGHVIERLMCDFTIDLDQALAKHRGAETKDFTKEIEKMTPLAEDGIVTVNGMRVTITEDGRPFARLAAAAFDAYLDTGQKRHSKAV